METDPSHTIEQVKSMINEKNGVPTDAMILELADVQLKDEQKLNECNIQNGATIDVKALSK